VSVAGCITEDTRRDITALLNDLSAEHGVDACEVLGGAVIAEAGWNERAARVRPFPDVSYGIGQPSVAWCVKPDGLTPSTDPRYRNANTPDNRELCREYFFDAERALRYCIPLYARIRAKEANGLDAWCRWNKPAIPPAENPNRAHYARSLAEAEQYRVTEEPVPDPITDPTEAIRQLQDQQAHQSEALYALACMVTAPAPHDNTAYVETLTAHVNALNPEKYVFPPKA
jgi:hypothetical protein